jgi:hypothetical protein
MVSPPMQADALDQLLRTVPAALPARIGAGQRRA